jgi:hypothetical protein
LKVGIQQTKGAFAMAPVQVTPVTESMELRVGRLLATWRAETAHVSSSTRITSHPAYQEIIALGTPALPFLFRDLEQTIDGHLSKALTAITGAHPVPAQERGQIGKVAAAWLGWARENDHRW